MEITILSLFSNRPDFIKPQFDSLKKYLKDNFYYVVVNNIAQWNSQYNIKTAAQQEDVGYLAVRHAADKTDSSIIVKDTLNFLWKEFKNIKGILVIMDCDVFLTKDVSFEKLLEGYDMAFCPIYTEGRIWPWTGFMLFDMDKIKVDDVDFSFASINQGNYLDVGSGLIGYTEKHNPTIRLLKREEILDQPDERLKDFPHPYSVDFIEDFMYHYKTSSNYAPHCTPEYNEAKTKATWQLLTQ